jgi:hypothetical protein
MEPNDPLWQLLGRSPRAAAPGWFAARTLAACRKSQPEKSRFFGLVCKWIGAATAVLAVAVGVYWTAYALHPADTAMHEALNYLVENHSDGDEELWFDEMS